MSKRNIDQQSGSQFIRKLDFKETGLVKRGWDQNVIVKYLFKSKVDLFEPTNLYLMKSSILNVMQSEEFMRSRIIKCGDSEYFYQRFELDNYNFANVKFLRLKSSIENSMATIDFVAKLLSDYLAVNEINPDKKDGIPLWRFLIFEADQNLKLYYFIAQYYHSLIQGQSSSKNIYKILKTFEKLHQNETVGFKESKIFPGCEHLFDIKRYYNSSVALDPVKWPSFINPERAKAESINLFNQSIPGDIDHGSEIVCVDTISRFKSMSKLIEYARKNQTSELDWFVGKIFIESNLITFI